MNRATLQMFYVAARENKKTSVEYGKESSFCTANKQTVLN